MYRGAWNSTEPPPLHTATDNRQVADWTGEAKFRVAIWKLVGLSCTLTSAGQNSFLPWPKYFQSWFIFLNGNGHYWLITPYLKTTSDLNELKWVRKAQLLVIASTLIQRLCRRTTCMCWCVKVWLHWAALLMLRSETLQTLLGKMTFCLETCSHFQSQGSSSVNCSIWMRWRRLSGVQSQHQFEGFER